MSNSSQPAIVRRSVVAVAAVAALIALLVVYIGSRAAEKTARPVAAAQLEEAAPISNDRPPLEPPALPREAEVRVASVQAPPPSSALAEQALMGKLRDLGDASPLVSLALAREGNLRFPDSPDAAERAWWVCKSLVNLTDFAEAREEARAMVLKYPGTSFALDIERHLLINPGGPPEPPPEDPEAAP